MENESTDVMTAAEIATTLTADAGRLTGAERDLGQARASYRRMETMLGEERAREEYGSSLADRERETVAVIDAIERNTRSAISALEAAQQPTLEPEEMRAASAAAEFVKEDVADLPLTQLRDRMRAAALAGDRASCWLFLRYAPMRSLEAKGPGDAEAAREIRALLAKLTIDLRPKTHDASLAEARELLGQAVNLRAAATAAQRQADAEKLLERMAMNSRSPRSAWVPIPPEHSAA